MPVGRCVMRIAESVTLRCWPAAPARPVGVDPQVLLVDLHLDVVGQLGPDVDRRERGVAAGCLVERRDADEPVDAGLGRHQAVGVVAGDGDRGALDAGLVARLVVDDLALEAAALGPAQVHAQQHLRPVLRLGAAGARVDGDDGVLLVVLAAEHLPGLGRVDLTRRARRGPAASSRPTSSPCSAHSTRTTRSSSRFFSSVDQLDFLLEPVTALQHLLRLRPGPSRNRAGRPVSRGGSVRRAVRPGQR